MENENDMIPLTILCQFIREAALNSKFHTRTQTRAIEIQE